MAAKAGLPEAALNELLRFSEREKSLLRPLLERAAPYLNTWMSDLTPQHAALGCAAVYGFAIWQRMSAIKALAAAMGKPEQRSAPAGASGASSEPNYPPPAPAVDASTMPGSPY